MVKFYASWCPKIDQNPDALDFVKKSNLIDGIEGSYEVEDYFLDENNELNYSYHNPTFKKFANINDSGFILDWEKNDKLRLGINISAPKVIGFHPPLFESEFVDFINNLNFLKSKTDKKLLIEPRPFWTKNNFESKKGFENSSIKNYLLDEFRVKISSVDFLDKFMSENDLGMLLDISHTRITILSLIEEGYYNGTLDEFFLDLVKKLGDRINQIHINHSKFSDGIFLDSHSLLFEECEALRILKLISPYLNNVEFITLEIYTGLEPLEHVKEMEKQAQLVKRYF